MGFKALTVNTPVEQDAHIFAEDDAVLYGGIIGGDCVLPVGGVLAATIISNNAIRIKDGMVCVGGHIGRIVKGDYEDMAIANGVSGQNRNDLIVARFVSGGTGGADTYGLVVIQGTPGAAAKDPAVVKGDLYAGERQRDYPLYRVRLEGLSVAGLDKLYEVGRMLPDKVNISDIVDNLTTKDAKKPLSSKQGNALDIKKLDKDGGNGANLVNTFTQATTRANLASGEKQSITLGKIMKFFADLKTGAFNTVVNNLTTTAAGYVMDARQGKILSDLVNTKFDKANIWYADTSATTIVNFLNARIAEVKKKPDGFYVIYGGWAGKGEGITLAQKKGAVYLTFIYYNNIYTVAPKDSSGNSYLYNRVPLDSFGVIETGNGIPNATYIDAKNAKCYWVRKGDVCQVALEFTPLKLFSPGTILFTGLPASQSWGEFQYVALSENGNVDVSVLYLDGTVLKEWYSYHPKVGVNVKTGFTYICRSKDETAVA